MMTTMIPENLLKYISTSISSALSNELDVYLDESDVTEVARKFVNLLPDDLRQTLVHLGIEDSK